MIIAMTSGTPVQISSKVRFEGACGVERTPNEIRVVPRDGVRKRLRWMAEGVDVEAHVAAEPAPGKPPGEGLLPVAVAGLQLQQALRDGNWKVTVAVHGDKQIIVTRKHA